MKPFQPPSPILAKASYAAYRYGGDPPALVQVQLELPAETVARLERLFLADPGSGAEAMRPRFARHEAHVDAARAAGGFPILPERRGR
jgi:hypothetical protein